MTFDSVCVCFQAEIKRLQEANRAARKERQLLLKQQEEIARMRYTTLKLKERLKCVGTEDTPPVSTTTFLHHIHIWECVIYGDIELILRKRCFVLCICLK